MMATAGLRARAPSTTRLVTLASECLGVPADEIDVRAPLSRYGLDSLTAVELTAALATELGRELPDSVLLEYPDIESLERFLAAGRGDEALAESALRQMWADAVLPPEIRPGAPAATAGAARAVLLTGAGVSLFQALGGAAEERGGGAEVPGGGAHLHRPEVG